MPSSHQGPALGSLYRLFLFLGLAQLSVLTFLLFLGPVRRAEVYVPEGEPVLCEDQRREDLFVPLHFPMYPLHCEGEECSYSRYVQPGGAGDSQVHVVAVEGGRTRRAGWPTVEVSLHPTEEPVRLVLSSKKPVQWQLKGVAESKLKEVHIVVPTAARVGGLGNREDIGLYWHGQDVVCVQAHSWWDRDNPNNEFQRFIAQIRTLLGSEEVSFQGFPSARRFEVPFYESKEDEVAHVMSFRRKWGGGERQLASGFDGVRQGPIYELENHALKDKGWGKLDVASGQTEITEPIPQGRRLLGRRSDGKFHLTTDGVRLFLYSPSLHQEIVVPPPEDLRDFSRLHLAQFLGTSIVAYFRDYGGVVRTWQPREKTWEPRYDLYRQELDAWLWEGEQMWGLSVYKSTATVMKFDAGGRKIASRDFLLPWELPKRRARFLLERQGEDFLLKHHSAHTPRGRWYLLESTSGHVQLLVP